MNPTQACVVPFRQPSQQTIRSTAHRTQKYRRASVRYLSRSEYQRPQTDRLAQTSTQHSIETPQPRSLQEPSQSSSVNADLASDLSPAAWNNLGIALAGLEQYDDALSAFEQALKLDPTFDRAEYNARQIQDL